MKKLFYLSLITLAMGCQSESLDIRASYRIRLQTADLGKALRAHQTYSLPMELLTDSYYSKYGYQLIFYQQSGLGRLSRGKEGQDTLSVLQNVPVSLPLGHSDWRFTPEATGISQVLLIAQQERGYTQPDTVRLSFQVIP